MYKSFNTCSMEAEIFLCIFNQVITDYSDNTSLKSRTIQNHGKEHFD